MPLQKLHQGLTLEDLFKRVRENGASLAQPSESSNFELQQQRLRELLSGVDSYESCQNMKRDEAYAAIPQILARMEQLNAAVNQIKKHLKIPD